MQTRSIMRPHARPRSWPELSEDHSRQLARRALEMMEVQALHGEQTIEGWADYAGRMPEELCGYLAELARCTSRAFIELFGCASAPERVKGVAYESSPAPSESNSNNEESCSPTRGRRHGAMPQLASPRATSTRRAKRSDFPYEKGHDRLIEICLWQVCSAIQARANACWSA